VPSGVWVVTRWPPRTLARAVRIASRPAPARSRMPWPSRPPPRSRAAGARADVVVLEAASLVARLLEDALGARVEREGAPGELRSPREDASDVVAEAGTSTPIRWSVRAGCPSGVRQQGGEDVLGIEHRALELGGERCAPRIASWAFWVKRSRFIGVSRDPFVGGGRWRPRGGRRWPGRQPPRGSGWWRGRGSARLRLAPRRTGRWEDDAHLGEQVAALVLREDRHPLALEADRPAVLGAGGDLEEHAAVERRDRDLRAQEGLAEGHGEVAGEIRAGTREDAVRRHPDDEHEVAAIAALAAEPDAAAGVDAARDPHLEALPVDLDDARRPGGGLLERDLHLGLHRCLPAGAAAAAVRAGPALAGRPRRAAGREPEACRAPPPMPPSASMSAPAGHPAAENIRKKSEKPESSARPCGTRSGRRRARAGRPAARVPANGPPGPKGVGAAPPVPPGPPDRSAPVGAELVVALPLLGVGEDRVRLVDRLEARLGRGIAGLTSGWCWRASLRKAFLISAWVAVLGTPRVS